MKITNKQISKTFILAKSLLCDGSDSDSDSGNPSYICHAIDDIRYQYAASHQPLCCKNIIMSRFPTRLGKDYSHCVETYLHEVVKVPYSKLTYKNVQQFRHRWLDSLIEEFDKPGMYEG